MTLSRTLAACSLLVAMLATAPALRANDATATAIHAAVLEANPNYQGKATFRFRDDKLSVISLMKCVEVTTSKPFAAFDLSAVQSIICYQAVKLEDLEGFRGATSLRQLNVERCKSLADLSPVKDLPIGWIRMYDLPLVKDIEVLREMPLFHADMGKCPQITDISPLAGKKLKDLRIDDCPGITDISVVADMTDLELLSVFNCPGIKDYSAIRGLTPKTLLISPELMTDEDLAAIRAMDSLEILGANWIDWKNKMTPAQFWARYDAQKNDQAAKAE